MSKDLDKTMSEAAAQNQAPPTGQRLLIEVEGVLFEYFHVDTHPLAVKFAKKLQAEIDWIETFTSHAPSVGTHYERILSDLVSEILPSTIKVGTGFVFDSLRGTASPQIDLLCYRDDAVNPIYRRGDFVIVQPESVLLACEIKKTLRQSDVAGWVRKTVGCNMGDGPFGPLGVQTMAMFAYTSKVKTETIVRTIETAISNYLNEFYARTKEGDPAILAIQQLCLPAIFVKGREEHIAVSIRKNPNDPFLGKVYISVLKAGNPAGVTPFLGLLTSTASQRRPSGRDHVASYLYEEVSETAIEPGVLLQTRIGAAELLDLFPDARAILSRNRAYAAIFSSFEKPADYKDLQSFERTNGFRWLVHEQPIQPSVDPDA